MNAFHLPEYKLRVVWSEETGVSASFCTCDDELCGCGYYIDRKEFIHDNRIRSPKKELYMLYRYMIKQNQQPSIACDLIVGRMIEQHRTNVWRFGVCDHGYNHDLLYIAARLAVEFKLHNDNTLVQLLMDIYGCEFSFDRLFSGVLHTSGYLRDFGNRMSSIRVLKFLLAAAERTRITFFYNGQLLSMSNVPLSNGQSPIVATSRGAGGSLMRKMLRRYGASSPSLHEYEYDSEGDSGPED